jgi:hypothetical protein
MECSIARVGLYARRSIGNARRISHNLFDKPSGMHAPSGRGAFKEKRGSRKICSMKWLGEEKPRTDRDLTRIRINLSAIAYRTGLPLFYLAGFQFCLSGNSRSPAKSRSLAPVRGLPHIRRVIWQQRWQQRLQQHLHLRLHRSCGQ